MRMTLDLGATGRRINSSKRKGELCWGLIPPLPMQPNCMRGWRCHRCLNTEDKRPPLELNPARRCHTRACLSIGMAPHLVFDLDGVNPGSGCSLASGGVGADWDDSGGSRVCLFKLRGYCIRLYHIWSKYLISKLKTYFHPSARHQLEYSIKKTSINARTHLLVYGKTKT